MTLGCSSPKTCGQFALGRLEMVAVDMGGRQRSDTDASRPRTCSAGFCPDCATTQTRGSPSSARVPAVKGATDSASGAHTPVRLELDENEDDLVLLDRPTHDGIPRASTERYREIGRGTEPQRRAKQGFELLFGIDAFWLENFPTTPVSVTSTLSAWMPSG